MIHELSLQKAEIMDHKAWIWRKKSSEKTKVDASLTRSIEEETVSAEKETIADLNEKLAAALISSQAQDELLTEQTKMAEEAIAAREKAETEAGRLKQELDVANESLSKCNTDLDACKEELRTLREEQEQKMRESEEKYTEMSKRVENLSAENAGLSQAIQVKEKLVGNLQRGKAQAEAEFDALMARSDSTEKENAFLKYEFHVLQKELEIRCEELEFYRRSADISQKQNAESVKKVTKLEAECQRLRALMRKKLPGPSAVAKMKSEVEMLRGDQIQRRKPNPARDLAVRDNTMERLHDVEEENKILKEIVAKMKIELNSSSSRIMSARISSRSFHSLTSGFDIGSDDGISSSGSWANALTSELEHVRHERLRNPPELKAIEDSDMSLMDDFVEMEKLAIVSVDTPSESGYHSNTTDKDLFPVVLDKKQEIKSRDAETEKPFDWLQDVLNAMLKQTRVSNRSLHELLEDIRIALGYINHPSSPAETDVKRIASHPEECDSLGISGYITWKSSHPSPTMEASRKQTTNKLVQSNLSTSIRKIMNLVEGFNPTLLGNSTEYFVRVFQWRNSELNSILQRFIQACNDLLNEKVGLEKFTEELSFALEWILNNYAAPTEASSMREKIKKQIVSSELQIQNEVSAHVPEEKSLSLIPDDANQCDLWKENGKLKDELMNSETAKRDMETKLLSATDRTEDQMIQLEELKKSSKESREMVEDEVESQTLIIEDLDTEAQLTVAKAKLNEVFQKVSSLEVELEDKRNCCEELEATCLELQLQLESVAKKETETHQDATNEEEKQPHKEGWEITAASVKLAECQETILNLGKQLKALASPRESSVFDRTISPATNNKNLAKRSSLRDQMLAEDTDKSPKTCELISIQKRYLLHSVSGNALQYPNLSSRHEVSTSSVGALAIVPIKKQGGGGFLRRLLLRRKKGSNKKKLLVPK